LSTVSTARWGVFSGPVEEPDPVQRPSAPPAPEVVGEFVSDDLRSDTARFLDELHERMRRRRERAEPPLRP
jgi:hypothetical protein